LPAAIDTIGKSNLMNIRNGSATYIREFIGIPPASVKYICRQQMMFSVCNTECVCFMCGDGT
jgi:hypothetical protein